MPPTSGPCSIQPREMAEWQTAVAQAETAGTFFIALPFTVLWERSLKGSDALPCQRVAPQYAQISVPCYRDCTSGKPSWRGCR